MEIMEINKLRKTMLDMKLNNNYFFQSNLFIDESNCDAALGLISQYITYFYKADLIKLNIYSQSTHLIEKIKAIEKNTSNTLQDKPETLIYIVPTFEKYQQEIAKNGKYGHLDCNTILKTSSADFAWLALYKKFHSAIKIGNSWYEYGDVSSLYDVCKMLNKRKNGENSIYQRSPKLLI
jgi:hypothetical protein